MERIGILGGSFNPPHIGHIQGALCAARELGLSRVLLVPAREVPHKEASPQDPAPMQRLEMLRLAASGYDNLEVSDAELCREGVSYTCDTVRQLRGQFPQAELTLLMGSDMFRGFSRWKDSDEIVKQTGIGVLSRGDKRENEAIEEGMEALTGKCPKVSVISNPAVYISSTQLRRLLAFGSGEEFLPEGVHDYILENKLYDTGANWKQLPMEQLEPIVIRLLKASRVKHVLGCRDTCVALAKHWGADETDAARAGILHDITKALDGPLQLTLCASYGKILDDFSKKYPKTLHALTGSLVAERIFGENQQVVSAICSHTTGKPGMNLLETIVYVADYMEPNRDFPGVERLRELAFSDIRAALKLGLEMTLEHLKNQGSEVSPQSREALEALNSCP